MLREASVEEIVESLAFALRYEGRKRVNHADETMARITADRLVRHLAEAGFVLMRRPGGRRLRIWDMEDRFVLVEGFDEPQRF